MRTKELLSYPWIVDGGELCKGLGKGLHSWCLNAALEGPGQRARLCRPFWEKEHAVLGKRAILRKGGRLRPLGVEQEEGKALSGLSSGTASSCQQLLPVNFMD